MGNNFWQHIYFPLHGRLFLEGKKIKKINKTKQEQIALKAILFFPSSSQFWRDPGTGAAHFCLQNSSAKSSAKLWQNYSGESIYLKQNIIFDFSKLLIVKLAYLCQSSSYVQTYFKHAHIHVSCSNNKQTKHPAEQNRTEQNTVNRKVHLSFADDVKREEEKIPDISPITSFHPTQTPVWVNIPPYLSPTPGWWIPVYLRWAAAASGLGHRLCILVDRQRYTRVWEKQAAADRLQLTSQHYKVSIPFLLRICRRQVEAQRWKTCLSSCAHSEDSDQTAHSRSLIWIFSGAFWICKNP